MIPEARLKLDPRGKQRGVRLLELLDEVIRRLAAIHVVAEHDDEVEGESRAGGDHLPADIVLGLIAGTVVAHRDELQRPLTIR